MLQYTQTFDLGGRPLGAFIVLPYVDVDGDISAGPALDFAFGTSGTADVILGFAYGLSGTPAFTPAQYAAYDPGFDIGVLGKLTLPTGKYDDDARLNIGGNRVVLQAGLPMAYFAGTSFLDPNLTTFELTPAVTVFGDNENPPGAADSTGQEPLFTLEGHVTRNLGRRYFISADALWAYGGETRTNGIGNDDLQNSFGVGATFGASLGQSTQLKVSYGEIIASRDGSPDATLFRVVLSKAF